MASSSSSKHKKIGEEEEENDEEEEDTAEEYEVFDDFTIASSWERFISDIEASCRQWLADGSKNLVDKGAEALDRYKNLYRVKKELKYGGKAYSMEFNFVKPVTARASCWDDDLHNMQLSFGVDDFLVIAPLSANGVVLDDPESTKLLSSVAIALSNCGSNWPAFVPVHDPSRKAYIGIQNMGANFTRRFEADRIASQVPVRLMHLEGLYELFISKFVLSTTDFSTNYFKVQFAMRLTYETPPYDYDQEEILESEIEDSVETETSETTTSSRIKKQWDDGCPWTEWYSAEDPIQGFDLTAIWRSRTIEGSHEMAELENTSSFDAEHWLLTPIIYRDMVDDSISKFVGFASQIRLLISAFDTSFGAQFLEDFVAAENTGSDNSKSTANVPPPTVLDRVLKELFLDGTSSNANAQLENRNSRVIKGAPLQSLFAQFCLHALWFGNCSIRAIAVLWIDFVREIRWYWEESEPLPKVSSNGTIDLSCCILHQKLQMLAICIERKRSRENDQTFFDCEKEDGISSNKVKVHKDLLSGPPIDNIDSSLISEDSKRKMKLSNSSDQKKFDKTRRGSAGIVQSMMLLNSFEEMHAPYTQSAPLMTEDMHEERLHAAEALGNTMGFSGQLEKDILSSDMSAFKAANPNAVFEDFIRWHSPGDWETDDTDSSSVNKLNWPPKGRLSQRMSEHGNLWHKIWNESPALPISEQKPLLDPVREGEKVMHYLETLRPQQLLEQMICTAFRACAGILNQTSYGGFKLMKTKVDQLYVTLGSSLKFLQGKQHNDKDELVGDLKQLCTVFEHIEKLVILAASIYRKLADAPRLSEAIFTDYFNFYLPKMGTGLTSICYDKEFDTKQEVKIRERDAVAAMFPPPSVNQSWRKVLSMGNLLNGHEPTQREIIFSVNDTVSNSHYGNKISVNGDEEVETYHMYIRGTSNDLWAALSVTSWD
ncbi:Rab3 GTPase-activating protein catalytic subunit [Rhynchospora pubera]|uniref:Rab3 GTPase-activating protein catalytic subunit n=1 Tax=Rhynchospora pubera TaxID=906938 RepID=A0AAV8FHX8_9POAL|nr:Rab3 GTPase-activating protein catalytic subunit [Rhynchospora pubera]